jgi:hypothetical protein
MTFGFIWRIPLLLALQAPGDGWALKESQPGEIGRVYWALFDTTEVWVRLDPDTPGGSGKAPLRLVFQVFYQGREAKGPPKRLGLRAVGPAVADLSLRLTLDGTTIDLTGRDGSSRPLLPVPNCEECSANGVDAELKTSVWSRLMNAASVSGTALGVPFVLSSSDCRIIRSFAKEFGGLELP